ncbi:MAG: cyclopropane-fatty-acyl-phospholipid synthase, partial [Gammaproteobacteria bacterium]
MKREATPLLENGKRPEKVLSWEKGLLKRILKAMGNPPIEVTLWDGETLRLAPSPVARIAIRNRGAFYKVLLNPNLHFGDAYSEGSIEVEGDLVRFLESVADTGTAFQRFLGRLPRPRPNTLKASKENIHHHYDIGNDFYRLWLDDEMVYTCAYYPTPEASLEEAQQAKMEHVC